MATHLLQTIVNVAPFAGQGYRPKQGQENDNVDEKRKHCDDNQVGGI
jgi:hypothetical protein